MGISSSVSPYLKQKHVNVHYISAQLGHITSHVTCLDQSGIQGWTLNFESTRHSGE